MERLAVNITQEMIDAADYRTVASIESWERALFVEPGAYEPEKGTIKLEGRVSYYELPGYKAIRRADGVIGYIIDDKLYTKTYTS